VRAAFNHKSFVAPGKEMSAVRRFEFKVCIGGVHPGGLLPRLFLGQMVEQGFGPCLSNEPLLIYTISGG
jgi:hypothetical protein